MNINKKADSNKKKQGDVEKKLNYYITFSEIANK